KRKERHGPTEESTVPTARRLGAPGEPRLGDRRVENSAEREGVLGISTERDVATIERYRGVGGGEQGGPRPPAEISPDAPRRLQARSPDTKERPPGTAACVRPRAELATPRAQPSQRVRRQSLERSAA